MTAYYLKTIYLTFITNNNRKNIKNTKAKKCGGVFILREILVVFGGKSCEHDISIITGVLTANSIDKEKYSVRLVYINAQGEWYSGEVLKNIEWYKKPNYKQVTKVTLLCGDNTLYKVVRGKLKKIASISCCINCLHGINGEDGTLQGVISSSDIAFASPELFQSSFAIDKDFTKIVLSGLRVPALPYVRILKDCFFTKKDIAVKMVESKLKYPVIIKPARLGSSIGIKIAKNSDELVDALITAFSYDTKVIVERALTNFIEINCSAYKIKDEIFISELERPFKKEEILSFSDKYLSQGDLPKKEFPAKISDKLASEIKKITEKVYRKCCFTGIIRIDFLIDGEKVYLNEINTVPGSLAYYLHCLNTKEFSALLTKLIENGVDIAIKNRALKKSYSVGVLNVKGIKGSKKTL